MMKRVIDVQKIAKVEGVVSLVSIVGGGLSLVWTWGTYEPLILSVGFIAFGIGLLACARLTYLHTI